MHNSPAGGGAQHAAKTRVRQAPDRDADPSREALRRHGDSHQTQRPEPPETGRTPSERTTSAPTSAPTPPSTLRQAARAEAAATKAREHVCGRKRPEAAQRATRTLRRQGQRGSGRNAAHQGRAPTADRAATGRKANPRERHDAQRAAAGPPGPMRRARQNEPYGAAQAHYEARSATSSASYGKWYVHVFGRWLRLQHHERRRGTP